MAEKSRQVIQNRDNNFLLPEEDEGFAFGDGAEVNSDRNEEIAGFTPTREELIQFVKYSCKEYFFIEWIVFVKGARSDNDCRDQCFANRRISLAKAVIGEKGVNKAIKEVRKEFKAESDVRSRYCDIVENGD